jgi:xylulose-5-phosphate/fructose-6-phosphate phosphoketolase
MSTSQQTVEITCTVWRQDHNGFTHQDPGFLDVVVDKSAAVTRIYLPPDVNSVLSVADHCLRSENYENVIVSDKQLHLQYVDLNGPIRHCTKVIGIWEWASNDQGGERDVVMASAGDIRTQEALAAGALLRVDFPEFKVRYINVVDLFKLQPSTEHPHGLTDRYFDSLFTVDRPIIFNFHRYPWLGRRLAYRRTNHSNVQVRGYKEKGNISMPIELAINNEIDRFTPAIEVIDRTPKHQRIGAHAKEKYCDQRTDCDNYAYEHGIDKPEIVAWRWPY